MRVGIITIQNAINYGSTLQAYALQECLKELGYNARVVEYQNTRLNGIYRNKYSLLPSVKWIVKGHIRSGVMDLFNTIRNKRNNKYRRMLRAYDAYRVNKLDLTSVVFDKNDRLLGEFDALICGSDQIWRSSIVGDDGVYYLNIPNYKGRKIAYAASGDAKSCEVNIDSIKRLDYISVREDTLVEELNGMGVKNAELVCDPTFLCPRSFWRNELSNNTKKIKDYIFAYLIWDEPVVIEFIKKLSLSKNLPVVCIHRAASFVVVNGKKINTASPQSFIDLLANARYTVVNSFHGLVFSLIYEKQFMVFPSDRRIESYLEKYDLNSRSLSHESTVEKIDTPIDWENIRSIMDKEREFGVDYLKNALLSAQMTENENP